MITDSSNTAVVGGEKDIRECYREGICMSDHAVQLHLISAVDIVCGNGQTINL